MKQDHMSVDWDHMYANQHKIIKKSLLDWCLASACVLPCNVPFSPWEYLIEIKIVRQVMHNREISINWLLVQYNLSCAVNPSFSGMVQYNLLWIAGMVLDNLSLCRDGAVQSIIMQGWFGKSILYRYGAVQSIIVQGWFSTIYHCVGMVQDNLSCAGMVQYNLSLCRDGSG